MTTTANDPKPTDTPHIAGDGIRTADVLFWLSLPGELAAIQRMFARAAMRDGHRPEAGEEAYDRLIGWDYDGTRIESVRHAIRSAIRYCRLAHWRPGCGFPHRGARAATWGRACFLNGGDAPEMQPVGRSYASLPDRSPNDPATLAAIFEVAPRLREELVGVAGECEVPTGRTVFCPGGRSYAKIDHRQRRGYERVYEAGTVRD